MPTHNIIQNPGLVRRLTELLGLRQAHVTPSLNEGVQAVVVVDDLRGGGTHSELDAQRFSLGTFQTRINEDTHVACTQLRNPVDSKSIARVRSVRLELVFAGTQDTTLDRNEWFDVLSAYVNSGTVAAAGLTGIGRGLLDDPGGGGVANFSRRGFAYLAENARRGNSTCFVDMGGVTNNDPNIEPQPFRWQIVGRLEVTNPGPDVAGITTAVTHNLAPYKLEINFGVSGAVAQGPVLHPGDTFALWIPFTPFCNLTANWEWQEFANVVGG